MCVREVCQADAKSYEEKKVKKSPENLKNKVGVLNGPHFSIYCKAMVIRQCGYQYKKNVSQGNRTEQRFKKHTHEYENLGHTENHWRKDDK